MKPFSRAGPAQSGCDDALVDVERMVRGRESAECEEWLLGSTRVQNQGRWCVRERCAAVQAFSQCQKPHEMPTLSSSGGDASLRASHVGLHAAAVHVDEDVLPQNRRVRSKESISDKADSCGLAALGLAGTAGPDGGPTFDSAGRTWL